VLAPLDWALVAAYLIAALWVGFHARDAAGQSRHSYFLADRSLPWWWAGTSIAATTFAADTPLAITGIIAARGLSGNWLWLAWILVHAGVVVVFARRWWRTGVVTDAEFIALRYSGPAAGWLRSARAGLYGLVINAIILGWVLRAMGKIVQPLVPWHEWAPGLTAGVARVMPAGTALGGPGEMLTILLLVALVTAYSMLGGIRGVVRTDLVQFALGLLGSAWLAVAVWRAVGGRSGLREGLVSHYGAEAGMFTALLPTFAGGWAGALGLGAFSFGAYLLVQSFSNVPADGGGYLQQRLCAARSEADAQKAAGLFVVLHYLVRVWPWFIVALGALVLLPLGAEQAALGGDLGRMVHEDREMAYPALMVELLPAGALGILVVSLLAAFMSTIDTHFNWGASYVVSDLALRVRPNLSPARQVLVGRLAVLGFALLAIVVAVQIERIEQAWRWVAALGAALGIPTLLRWCWWRITATAELAGAGFGLLVAVGFALLGGPGYERELIWTAAASILGVAAAILVGPRPDPASVRTFMERVDPPGVWPGRDRTTALAQVLRLAGMTLGVSAAVMAVFWVMKWALVG
jgi:solute:Na+ symporter, SSS family